MIDFNDIESLKKAYSNDWEHRVEICKIVGFEGVPEPDSEAIDKLSGLLSEYYTDEIDVVELIKQVRESRYLAVVSKEKSRDKHKNRTLENTYK